MIYEFKIFNMCITSGKHPDKLKLAHALPIYKKGSRRLVSNYRPISLLSNLNKILEKIMHKRVYAFLEKYEILYELQFGFRAGYSTTHALIHMTDSGGCDGLLIHVVFHQVHGMLKVFFRYFVSDWRGMAF